VPEASSNGAYPTLSQTYLCPAGFHPTSKTCEAQAYLTGAVTLFDYGLQMGGPLEMTLGWPLATVGTLFVALSMAELCSALPTSGGTYHWSAELGGPTWAWFTLQSRWAKGPVRACCFW
jgi:hypothetical protein